MTTAEALLHVFRLLLTAGAFLLPGWLLGRAVGTPFPALTTVLASAAMLFNGTLVLDALRIPLHIGTLGLLVCLGCALLTGPAWRRRMLYRDDPRSATVPKGLGWLWAAAVMVAGLSVLLRAILDPLSGFDNPVRWDYLARVMLAQQSLDHYPPHSAEDFRIYPWCDGIPPLIPVLNFLTYAGSGSDSATFTALRVAGEACLVGVAVFRLAQRLGGQESGWPALAALASSALPAWAIAMGQETGFTTLSFVALVLLLEEQRADGKPRTAGWAGLAAGVGAISREYGLAFILFGGAVLVLRRAPRAALARFAQAACLVAGPWYVRNGILTGNPLFPHALGGLFPSNVVHQEFMRAVAGYFGVFSGVINPWLLLVPLVPAGPLLLLAIGGALRADRGSLVCVCGIGLIAGLWWWSIPQTGGGWGYSTRVLAPALAVAAALAGGVSRLPRSVRIGLATVLLLLSIDAARRSWLLPNKPTAAPLPYSWEEPWREARRLSDSHRTGGAWKVLVEAAQGRAIVADHPLYQVQINRLGGQAVPWFSPQAAAMFETGRPFMELRRILLEQNVRFITISGASFTTRYFAQRYPFLMELAANERPVLMIGSPPIAVYVYDLDLIRSEDTTGAGASRSP